MVQLFWLLLLYQYWILIRTPIKYPVVSLDLQGLPFHMLLPFIDEVDLGVGQLKALDLVLGGS